MNSVKQCFPNFEPQLIENIEAHALIKQFKAGDTIIKTGQYISTPFWYCKGKSKFLEKTKTAMNSCCITYNLVKHAPSL